ncbi:MAG: hypothetical protein ACREU0_09690, partial [Burkholderiales bacterium]
NKQEVETIMSFAAMQARNFALVSPMTSEQAEEEAVRQAAYIFGLNNCSYRESRIGVCGDMLLDLRLELERRMSSRSSTRNDTTA